jgi:hypothetical protein
MSVGLRELEQLKPNTTVEQRMVANGVFAGLSDAWVSFKQ